MKCARIALFLLLGVWPSTADAGILGQLLNPIGPPGVEAAATLSVPAEQRTKVHVILINGIDPISVCNFVGMRRYVQDLGFCNTTYFQMWEKHAIRKHIHRVRACHPDARIVVVGYSGGALVAKNIAACAEEAQQIDLLMYVAGNTIGIDVTSCPAHVRRVVNVRCVHNHFLGSGVDGAINVEMGHIFHTRVPMNRSFQQLLASELHDVACGAALLGR